MIHTTTTTINSSAGGKSTGSVADVASGEKIFDLAIPASTTNQPDTSVSFAVANLQSVILVASQNLTIKTNSTSAPGNTIALKAGVPFQWSRSAGYFANPFTADVTQFFYTSGTTAVALAGRLLTN